MFVVIYLLVSSLFELPFSLYFTFGIEEKYEMNRQTVRLFINDFVKTFLITSFFLCFIIPVVLYVVEWAGDYFYIYLTAVFFILSISLMWVYPNLIQPFFNTFTPLDNGELREQILMIANKMKFPLTDIYVVDGSLRSGHSNAYFIGLFKYRRIVIYDTLIKQVLILLFI